jgi:hypothetical protein
MQGRWNRLSFTPQPFLPEAMRTAALLAFAVSATSAWATTSVTVNTTSGSLIGVQDDGRKLFIGVMLCVWFLKF